VPAAERITVVDGLSGTVPYAYAASVPAGARTVFLAGACPLDRSGAVVGAGSFAEQATACLENMRLALAAAGAGVDDVVFLRALVASSERADLSTVWEAVGRCFGDAPPPGTLQGVTVLGWPDQLVEIEAVAAVAE
jgi:enamine deaminase RidA (YjgF/YER057c/UK114 family)